MGEPGRGGGEGTRRGRVAHWLARARLIAGRRFLTLGAGRRERFAGWAAASRVLLPPPPPLLRDMSERQGTGATNGKEKTSAENVPACNLGNLSAGKSLLYCQEN
ncbi:calmodulin regulator protein PCP4 isoform X2 [Neopsephotus bourkii]|uniref:calmodulin regulator protein PCP4 isoform X2 n=1 Tax=Neopsephotus bourkii TaxID=309878 RepID=UPI002AA586E5|nr:calmodulin regulator protein PCP4 isoform X2 [Neopsephotus bourkii]